MTTALAFSLRSGDEMTRLARFHRDVRWTGTIQATGSSPAMTTTGAARYHTIQGGLWIVGDHEQDVHLADGTFVRHTQLHWVAGWDPEAHEYRASATGSDGRFTFLAGRIEGRLLIFESIGRPCVRTRLFGHVADAETMTWRTEISTDGGPYVLAERRVCTTLAQPS
jgi:hypothetical protein